MSNSKNREASIQRFLNEIKVECSENGVVYRVCYAESEAAAQKCADDWTSGTTKLLMEND